MKKTVGKAAVILFWIGVWEFLALAVDNSILVATPSETVRELASLLGEKRFYRTVLSSLLRIGAGFAAGVGVGGLLAAAGSRFPLLEVFLEPVMSLMKTVPVASFAVLLLIWWGPSFLAATVSFLVVLPNLYIGVLTGLKNMDRKLLEMGRVFRMPFRNRFFYLYRPGLRPYLESSLKVSLGMCWKAGVAAEVIGVPAFSLGERLYLSKVYLNTAGLFAWTAVALLVSLLFERLMLRGIARFFNWQPVCRKPEGGSSSGRIQLQDLRKSYDGRTVLDGWNQVYEAGGSYCLRWPSGSGKTTLLRLIAGLEEPDEGSVLTEGSCSMVFQEDRLCEDYSAVKNVELVTGDAERAERMLGELLEADALHIPCRYLSGGMRRRVALVRAMEAESSCVLLDEPFTGMDPATLARAQEYIRKSQRGRLLILASHL